MVNDHCFEMQEVHSCGALSAARTNHADEYHSEESSNLLDERVHTTLIQGSTRSALVHENADQADFIKPVMSTWSHKLGMLL